jgi:hypothetical protein
MSESSATRDPPLGMGLAAVVFGTVGMLLFFLPVLSIPLGGIGVVFGLVGIGLALRRSWTSLRWAIVGLVVSGSALTVGIAIAEAPAGYLRSRAIPLNTQPVPERAYVPPPARPGD